MAEQNGNGSIAAIVRQNKDRIRLMLSLCVRCGMCAESCFLYVKNKRDPRYMPSYKMLNSLGLLFKKKDDVKPRELKEIEEIAWKRCVLCMRCYCPFGLDIPGMIGLARSMCRKKGVFYDYRLEGRAETSPDGGQRAGSPAEDSEPCPMAGTETDEWRNA